MLACFSAMLRLGFCPPSTSPSTRPSHQHENTHSVTFKHTSIPAQPQKEKNPKPDNKLKDLQNPQSGGMSFFQMWQTEMEDFPFLLQQVFLLWPSTSIHVLSPSISCYRERSPWVRTVKFTGRPVGMWICECITSSHFLFFVYIFVGHFCEKHEYAGCCWVVAVVIQRWASWEMAVVIWEILLELGCCAINILSLKQERKLSEKLRWQSEMNDSCKIKIEKVMTKYNLQFKVELLIFMTFVTVNKPPLNEQKLQFFFSFVGPTKFTGDWWLTDRWMPMTLLFQIGEDVVM